MFHAEVYSLPVLHRHFIMYQRERLGPLPLPGLLHLLPGGVSTLWTRGILLLPERTPSVDSRNSSTSRGGRDHVGDFLDNLTTSHRGSHLLPGGVYTTVYPRNPEPHLVLLDRAPVLPKQTEAIFNSPGQSPSTASTEPILHCCLPCLSPALLVRAPVSPGPTATASQA